MLDRACADRIQESQTLCVQVAFEAFHRRSGQAGHLLRDECYLPVTPKQGQLFAFCFVFLSPPICWKNTQTLGSERSSTCSEKAGSQARIEEEAACVCTRGTMLDSPSGHWGMCPPKGPQGCILGRRRAKQRPRAGLPEGVSGTTSRLLGRIGAFGALALVNNGKPWQRWYLFQGMLGLGQDHVKGCGDTQ